MGKASEKKPGKHIGIGILAHVDAGKTTLAEGILYQCGTIRKAGRVDHGNAFLDTYEMERARGITIFSKQARLRLGDMEFTLLDTPGHVDFAAEMERTLQVLDYGVLVISGADGVQGHVETLWRLLGAYGVPVFLFVNKMDQPGAEEGTLLAGLKERLDERCVCFAPGRDRGEWLEELAMCDEGLLERYLEGGELSPEEVAGSIADRKVFPCFFGSALKMEGIEELLEGLKKYVRVPHYQEEFGARVYKISRDEQGNRLTHMKVTGGKLVVKKPLDYGGEQEAEKPDQIRLYSGASYEVVQEVPAGSICAVTGLERTYAGQGLGTEQEAKRPLLEPVLTYAIRLPEGCDVHKMLRKLKELEEEEPLLHVVWQEQTGEIQAQIMGQMQMEILKDQIRKRFDVEAEFGEGNIVYKETILEPVEGVGHFEPLRHYAEVHLLLEPGEPGSGLQFDTLCSEDVLDRNWQRLILTHLAEKEHRGVLTGAPITDMRITLVAGRAHTKHTEGGDFRQATYRAVRQGLRGARCVLLEPVYAFRLEVPSDRVGRAMADIQRMQGTISLAPARDLPGEAMKSQGREEACGEAFGNGTESGFLTLTGSVPAASMGDYAREVAAYTGGRGRLFYELKGYEPCHNGEEVQEASAYDAEADLENPTGSVFCAHGAGFVVPWDQVPAYMHVEAYLKGKPGREAGETDRAWGYPGGSQTAGRETGDIERLYGREVGTGGRGSEKSARDRLKEDRELQAIFERTYGPVNRERGNTGAVYIETPSQKPGKEREAFRREKPPQGEDYLLVDGYNIIFAWEELKELAGINLEAARGRLQDLLCDYQGFRKMILILVFDAYRVEGNPGEIFDYHNIHVVYTREAETADQYIEKTVHEIGRKHSVTVATSDALEQVIILGQGARRMSARGLREEMDAASIEIRQTLDERRTGQKNTLFQDLPDTLKEHLEAVRLGGKDAKL